MSLLITYGNHAGHRLGRPRTDTPQPIALPPATFIKLISLGWQHGHFVTTSNDFYSFGTGDSWRLATGNKTHLPEPTLVTTFPSDYIFAQLECGEKFGASLDTRGALLVWGCGYSHHPAPLALPSPATHIATGAILLAAAMTDGSVALFNRRKRPMRHLHIANEFIVMVACGKSNLVSLAQSGRAFVCGAENVGVASISETPQLIAYPNEIASVFGYSNFWIVDREGSVAAFGANEASSLGFGMSEAVVLPRKCGEWPFLDKEIQQIAMGEGFTVVLTTEGKCYAAGKLQAGLSANRAHLGDFQTGVFVECDCFNGQKVAQIACGLNHAAVLIGGGLSVAYLRLLKVFDVNAFPREPVEMVTCELKRIMVDDGRKELRKIGLFPGDVCRFGGVETILVVGVLVDDKSIAVVKNDTQKYVSCVPMADLNVRFPLIGRNGYDLKPFNVDGRKVYIDTNLFLFGTIPGDTVDDGSQLFGSCGLLMYSIFESDHRIQPIDFDRQSLQRNGHPLIRIDTFDSDHGYFVEQREELVLHRSRGIGILRGLSADSSFYVTFLSHPQRARKLQANSLTFITRRDHRVLTDSMTFIFVDSTDQRTLDLVRTPSGLGVVAGITDSKVAVWVEKTGSNFGTVSLFDSAVIESLARVNGPLTVLGDFSANCADFVEFAVLPGDEMNDGTIVIGVKGGRVYGRNMRDEIAEVDVRVGIRVRHVFAVCEQEGEYVSTYNRGWASRANGK